MAYNSDREENLLNSELNDGKEDYPVDFELDEGAEKKNINEELYNDNNKKISPQTGFIFLIFLSVAVLIYGFVNLSRNISTAGLRKAIENEANNNSTGENQVVTEQDLRKQDTDGDGLNDYDEQYIYGTSPYLADSDSDSYDDKQEIQSQHDPLCPAGKDCRGNDGINNTTTDTEVTVTPTPLDTGENNESELDQETMNQLLGMTPSEVRDLLRQSGQLTEEQISQISDDELMAIFQEIISEQNQ
ncbi:MAG TPA: hypothetical protein PKZ16_00020 [bacterium]|nr:hypothetical protein [bacterium]HPL95590.1 hypothetical protein [bacterium]